MGMSRATLPSYWQSTSLQDLLREQMSIPNDLVEDDAIEDCTWARYGRGWLLHSGAADVLAAHAIPARNPDDITRINNIDHHAAQELLRLMPDDFLNRERQNLGPTVHDVLTTITKHPGTVTASGYIIGAHHSDERLSLNSVVVADNALLTFTPDIVASVPTTLPGLTDKQRTAYLAHQQACLTSRVYSQQWCAIRHRYGLRTALTGPTTLTEQRTARLAARGVRLTWA